MPKFLLGAGAYRRDYGNMPEVKLLNMFAEASPTAEGGVILQCRRGLDSIYSPGGGPIHGIFSKKGVFEGDRFILSGNSLYREETLLGTVMGTGITSWAASDSEIVVTRGQNAYSYNGTNLAMIALPDGFECIAVTYIAGRFIFIRNDSARAYFSDLLDARTVSGIDYFTAELAPDLLKDAKMIRGNLLLFGEESVEVWYPSANPDLPFTRTDQRLLGVGIFDTGMVAELHDTLVVVGSDSGVYSVGDAVQRISHHGIEERITNGTCFVFHYEGHKIFCIRLPTQTLGWDATTGEWCEFATYGETNWRANCATNVGPTPYFGSPDSADIWEFGDTFRDDGADLEAYFTAMLPISGGTVRIDSVEARMNTGWTVPLSGDDASPTLEMRISRSAGATWGNWRSTSLGGQGKYRTRARYNRCGLFDPPGVMVQFRITDQTPRRVTEVVFNEAGGGRGRG